MRELAPGDRFGSFAIRRVLGRGGMGVVYDAEDLAEGAGGRRVALKVIHAELARDPDMLARFEREARAAATVSHPNVVRLVSASHVAGTRWIAFELVDGASLGAKLQSGPLAWREAAGLGAQVASALAALHSSGLVHRDVKPSNIIIDGTGAARLADFGLVSKILSGAESEVLTRTGEVVGTLAYLSPEQANGQRAGPAADLYALGATLFELVTGRAPFQGDGLGLLAKQVREAPPRARSLAPAVPPELDDVIARLLAKAPASRGSARETAARLDAIAHGEGLRGYPRALLAGFVVIAVAVVVATAARSRPDAAPPVDAPVVARVVTETTPIAKPPRPAAVPVVLGSTAWRHDYSVVHVALSPDGEFAVTSDATGVVRAFNLEGQELAAIRPTGSAIPLAIATDGRHVRIASSDGSVLERDVAGGATRTIATVPAQIGRVTPAAFSRSSRALAVGVDRGVFLLDLSVGKSELITGLADSVRCLAVSSDGERVVAADEKEIRLWDRATKTSRGFGAGARVIAISPDGAHVLASRNDETVEVWAPDTSIGGPGLIRVRNVARSLAWVADDAMLIGDDFDLSAAKIGDAQPRATWPGSSITIAARGSLALTGGHGCVPALRDPASGQIRGRNAGHGTYVRSVAFSPDGRKLVSTSVSDARVWDVATGREVSCFEGHRPTALVPRAVFSREGDVVVSCAFMDGSDGRRVLLAWDPETGKAVRGFPMTTATVNGIAFLPRRRAFLACCFDGTIRLFRFDEREGLLSFTARDKTLNDVDVTPDGRLAISASADPELEIFDLAQPRETSVGRLRGHKGPVYSVRVSPDGKTVASAAPDGTCRLWNLERRSCERVLKTGAPVWSVAFSPDDKLVATADESTTLKLWDVATGKEVAQIENGSSSMSVAFSPDGKKLAAACASGLVKIYDVPP